MTSAASRYLHSLALVAGLAGVAVTPALASAQAGAAAHMPSRAQVLRGRSIVINHDCNGCHGGIDPSREGWLIGASGPADEFKIGPCYVTPGAQPCFITRPRNLTPDNETGLGRFSERQIYNALKYGLRPEDTPDVTITSTTPGKGNFPEHPHYLAVPMPWIAWRHMPDADLWAVAAYLKRGLKPVKHKVQESEGPPDFWASEYTAEKIGTAVTPPFPAAAEKPPEAMSARR